MESEISEFGALIEVTPEKLSNPQMFLSDLENAKKDISSSEVVLADMKQKLNMFKEDPGQTMDTHKLSKQISEREKQIKSSREQIAKAKAAMNKCKYDKASLVEDVAKISDWVEKQQKFDQSQGEDEVDSVAQQTTETIAQSFDALTVRTFLFIRNFWNIFSKFL